MSVFVFLNVSSFSIAFIKSAAHTRFWRFMSANNLMDGVEIVVFIYLFFVLCFSFSESWICLWIWNFGLFQNRISSVLAGRCWFAVSWICPSPWSRSPTWRWEQRTERRSGLEHSKLNCKSSDGRDNSTSTEQEEDEVDGWTIELKGDSGWM